jgi:hypothetical protein
LAEKPVRLMRLKAARAFAERLLNSHLNPTAGAFPHHRLEHFEARHVVYRGLRLVLFCKMAISKYKSNFSSTEGHEQERDSWRFVSVNERKLLRRCFILKR